MYSVCCTNSPDNFTNYLDLESCLKEIKLRAYLLNVSKDPIILLEGWDISLVYLLINATIPKIYFLIIYFISPKKF